MLHISVLVTHGANISSICSSRVRHVVTRFTRLKKHFKWNFADVDQMFQMSKCRTQTHISHCAITIRHTSRATLFQKSKSSFGGKETIRLLFRLHDSLLQSQKSATRSYQKPPESSWCRNSIFLPSWSSESPNFCVFICTKFIVWLEVFLCSFVP